MPAHKKGLTWAFALRTSTAEKEMVAGVVAEYQEFNIKISLNDAVRILIRRGATPPPTTVARARAVIRAHWDECPHCDEQTIGCPEGQFVKVAHDRIDQAVRPATQRPRLLPPPPGVGRAV
jgi:hypothetical protein